MVNIYTGYFKVLNIFTVILHTGSICTYYATRQIATDHPKSSSRAQVTSAVKPVELSKSGFKTLFVPWTAEELRAESLCFIKL